jgi:hypothetical protein
MVPFEVSSAMLNHITDWHLVLLNDCGHWASFKLSGPRRSSASCVTTERDG